MYYKLLDLPHLSNIYNLCVLFKYKIFVYRYSFDGFTITTTRDLLSNDLLKKKKLETM